MTLIYKFNYDGKDIQNILELCKTSKNLYNQTLYAVKQELRENNKFLSYKDLDKIMKETKNLEGTINYRLLKAQVSQQCIRNIDKDIKSYVKSIKDWSRHKDKYNGKPRLPKYKKEYNLLTYTNQCCTIKDGKINLSKELAVRIPQYDKYKDCLEKFQQVRVLPKSNKNVVIEIVYEKECRNEELDKGKYATIDLGINNLATVIFDCNETVLYNGRVLKSINQFANKMVAKYKSELEKKNGKKSSRRIRMFYGKRNARVSDLFHKISRNIVNKAIKYGIGTIVVGYNKGWKDSINIGKRNNQTFVQIPFDSLLGMLEYKCGQCGIKFIKNEESYTSKCDALAMEDVCKHGVYFGKRVKRGLFQSSCGKLINADVNGSLNILRKVIGDSDNSICRIINSGRLFRPVKYNIL